MGYRRRGYTKGPFSGFTDRGYASPVGAVSSSEVVNARGNYTDLLNRLNGIDQLPGAARLGAAVSSGTIFTTRTAISPGYRGLIVLSPYSSAAEVVNITAVSGTSVTVAPAITQSHAADAAIMLLPGGRVPLSVSGAVGDASTDDRATINTFLGNLSEDCTIIVDRDYRIASDITLEENFTLEFPFYGGLTIDDGVTVTIDGHVLAGNYEIFSRTSTGIIKFSHYGMPVNICWFDGSDLAARWNFCKAGISDTYAGRYREILVPPPYPGQNGSYAYGTDRYGWQLDSVLSFDGTENNLIWNQTSIIYARTSMTRMMRFSATSKIENAIFKNVELRGDANATYGIQISGGSRIQFQGVTNISGCTGRAIYTESSVAAISQLYFDYVYTGTLDGYLMYIDGGTNAIVDLHVQCIYAENGTAATDRVVHITNTCRDLKFDSIIYRDPGGTTLTNCVLITVNSTRVIRNVQIGFLHGEDVTNALRVNQSSGSTKLQGLDVGFVFAGSNAAVNMAFTQAAVIHNVYHSSDVTIASDCEDVVVSGGLHGTLTDNGSRSIINGWGTNAGNPASAGNWNGAGFEGAMVYDTSGAATYAYVSGGWRQLS